MLYTVYNLPTYTTHDVLSTQNWKKSEICDRRRLLNIK